MAFIERENARIYWNALGQGEPVVLIMGLGCSSAMWFRMAPTLARTHRVILLDNRGCGQTQTRTALVHRVAVMAEDVVAVLDAAGEHSAHVVGFSMGGMIAQQMALDHPARLRSLALLGTHPGGPWAIQAAGPVLRLLFDKAHMSAEESLRRMRPHTYGRQTPDALFEEDALVRLANMPAARDYQAQLYGLIYWSVYSRLPSITAPTLVMHGLEDALIPAENGRLLASRIPRSRLVELPHASHWLMTDASAECIWTLQQHLKQHST
ncbi:alpha/beta fold hydrolase [Limnohabitans sp.]|uniref:alpha/beta fold hydrolase n=1 Tax=Limnohabitans sp. TaxID=1907725 RepID=UPI00391D6E07